MAGMIIGFPTILIAFVIWGVCSVPEVEEGEPIYDESDAEKDSESETEASESPEEENIDQKDKQAEPVRRRPKRKTAHTDD
ncbi:Oidioi.mRNA.OKI2018_I69.PAR.g9337.t1.cds [Oikopleura dioica]|uniref:Oidioi.mRNA.OKI2018_I69.PAR.g9337.t1.cds n=1 Tax=Oikopleura dioica TaxID=34765 RepID=A0ABN7RQL3_OIKDI|nr:Oidioi.mRNA.OKI2018_I69.PAR.g9337.t1.cds [Oikopleura dioica]